MEKQTTIEQLRQGLFFALLYESGVTDPVLFLRLLRANRTSWFGEEENELRRSIDSFLENVSMPNTGLFQQMNIGTDPVVPEIKK